MVKLIAIPLIMIMIGTSHAGELGQECKYVRTIEVDKHGNTSGVQTYECKTAPREIITKTEIKEVRTCAAKLLFGFECDPHQPEGDQFATALTSLVSLGVIQ